MELDISKLQTFEDRYKYDVSNYVEVKKIKGTRKDGSKYEIPLKYISWAIAQKMAKIFDKSFKWTALKNNNDSLIHDGMVLIQMTFLGVTEEHYFPILDGSNRAISKPNAFDINTAQMRGMTKLFSMMSGFGLSLYTGEDIKSIDLTGQEENAPKEKTAETDQTKQKVIETLQETIDFIKENQEKYKNELEKILGNDDIESLSVTKINAIYNYIKDLKKKEVA